MSTSFLIYLFLNKIFKKTKQSIYAIYVFELSSFNCFWYIHRYVCLSLSELEIIFLAPKRHYTMYLSSSSIFTIIENKLLYITNSLTRDHSIGYSTEWQLRKWKREMYKTHLHTQKSSDNITLSFKIQNKVAICSVALLSMHAVLSFTQYCNPRLRLSP